MITVDWTGDLLAGGLQTVSTPRQADGQGLRFPFYEFEGTELNLSTLFVSLQINELVRL